MNDACIIIPYFGKWPNFLPIYFLGCGENQNIDFHFCTDLQKPDCSIPPNVYFHFYTLTGINQLLSNAVGFLCSITTPYKLCDARPAYGLIFDQLIEPYTFWGWGDIDVLYGQISAFHKAEDFKKFDMLSGRSGWISGSLYFQRNEERFNKLFLSNDQYKFAFTTSTFIGYDECNKEWSGLRNGEDIELLHEAKKSFTFLVVKGSKLGTFHTKFEDLIKESIQGGKFIRYLNGEVLDHSGRHYMLFHYVMVKRNPWFYIPRWQQVPDEFYITTTGFYTVAQFKSSLFPFISFWRIVRASPDWAMKLVKRAENKVKKVLS